MSRFYVIDKTAANKALRDQVGEWSIHGPFSSVAAAKRWIASDTLDTFCSGDSARNLGENADYSAACEIVESVAEFLPVPIVSARVELRAVEGAA